jgi:small subunit ribosomal protein S17
VTSEEEALTASGTDRSDDEVKTEAADTSQHHRRAVRKVREGVVVSNGMDKTAVVAVIERVRHPKYKKTVLQTKKLYAHDEANDVNVGDKVRVMETRPVSKTKRWRVVEVLERAK